MHGVCVCVCICYVFPFMSPPLPTDWLVICYISLSLKKNVINRKFSLADYKLLKMLLLLHFAKKNTMLLALKQVIFLIDALRYTLVIFSPDHIRIHI